MKAFWSNLAQSESQYFSGLFRSPVDTLPEVSARGWPGYCPGTHLVCQNLSYQPPCTHLFFPHPIPTRQLFGPWGNHFYALFFQFPCIFPWMSTSSSPPPNPHRRILIICILSPQTGTKGRSKAYWSSRVRFHLKPHCSLICWGGPPAFQNIPSEDRHRYEMHQAQNRTGTYFSKKIKFSQPTNRRIQGRTRDPGSWPTRLQRQQSF